MSNQPPHSTEQVVFNSAFRASGVLLHVTSLPSPYGVGDLGKSARAWIDRLHQADQSWWQVLPLGPTGRGNSPYQPTSSFAIDWNLMSPDDLIADRLLHESELNGCSFPSTTVDYEAVTAFKTQLLETVWSHFANRASQALQSAFATFKSEHAAWLDDYALFTALHTQQGCRNYLEWPRELVRRNPAALVRAERNLADEVERIRLAQFLVYRQTKRLREYAHANGVRLIGDLPFYVAPDSSDVWANPDMFLLDDDLRPRFVGGVPPDYFSEEGQRWGNPVYRWDVIRETDYRWCIDRILAVLAHVDLVRLDHFRGFEAAWYVPADATTARNGEWSPGPGSDFFHAIQSELGGLPLIAEDLGLITPAVNLLRDEFALPGTRVLQFAFDGNQDNPHLPQNFVPNTVAYTATHDNNTTHGWFDELPDNTRRVVCEFLQRDTLSSDEAAAELIRAVWSSATALAMTPLQDVLNLPTVSRMNTPGVAKGNWRWRCTNEMLASPAFQWLRELTTATKRKQDNTADLERNIEPELKHDLSTNSLIDTD